MTDGSPVSLEYEDAGLFLGVYGCGRGTPEEGGIARWMQSGMLLRFCEMDVAGRRRKVASVWGGWREGRQRKVASLRAGTPSGDTTRAP